MRLLICIAFILVALQTNAQKKPNMLIILGDDCTYSDLSIYGSENSITPNIDKLANEGLTFDNAFVSSSMCQPCRSELYTGLYPIRNGAAWNHSRSKDGTKSIVHHLKEQGYKVGIAGKVHVRPKEVFPFDMVSGLERSCVKETAEFSSDGISKFMQSEEPFCLVIGLVSPHLPWTLGNPENFPPEKIKLPSYIADTKETREDYARYLAEIQVMDEKVGKILEVLKQSGKEKETLVMFSSEQGSQMPGGKWTNWNTGVHTGLVFKWKGHIPQKVRTDALVQWVDVLPTLLDIIGKPWQDYGLDGLSFKKVLEGKGKSDRQYAYFIHNNLPEGTAYPIRAVTDGKYHYVRNLMPESIYLQRYLMGNTENQHIWSSWMFHSNQNEKAAAMINRYMHRPAEEFYDMENDPYNLNNISQENPELMEKMSVVLDKWMQEQGDPGSEMDTPKMLKKARAGAL
ncbi:sulfatase [Limibacter armeniacum]|uniref:sulfatase family protein n=1 Tax=Limibacter armeniacum TaxID=466084 RepID=UPI002FE6013E